MLVMYPSGGRVKMKTEKQPQGSWKLNNGNPSLDLSALPRCQANAKSTGKRCGKPAMKGKRVCYIHGGKSPGAPKGNINAYKHGACTKEWNDMTKQARDLLKMTKDYMKAVNEEEIL